MFNEKCTSEWIDYFDKYICHKCDKDYCLRCKKKLTCEDKELVKKCEMCWLVACRECMSLECNVCGNGDYGESRCFGCYGSVIELCCGCYCCIQCLMFKNDDKSSDSYKIKYCKKHDNYVCDFCCNEEDVCIDHELLPRKEEPINPIRYVYNNGDKCIPKLNKLMYFMVDNPGYRSGWM